MSGSAHISELTFKFPNNQSWAMVRTHFDIQSFGVNAYIAEEAGRGDRRRARRARRALRRARGALLRVQRPRDVHGQRRRDRRAGRDVRLRPRSGSEAQGDRQGGGDDDRDRRRRSRARRSRRRLGSELGRARPLREQGLREGGRGLRSSLLAETPGDAGFLYNLACAESLLGRKEDALEHLRQSVEVDAELQEERPRGLRLRRDPRRAGVLSDHRAGGRRRARARSAGTGSASGRATTSTAP